MTKLALYWDPMRPTTSRVLCRECVERYTPRLRYASLLGLDVVSPVGDDDERLMRGCDDCRQHEAEVRGDD